MVAGMLSYQVTGWFIGDRVFDDLNSEAMLFTFSLGSVTKTMPRRVSNMGPEINRPSMIAGHKCSKRAKSAALSIPT